MPGLPTTSRIACVPAARVAPPTNFTAKSTGGAEARIGRATLRDPSRRPGSWRGQGGPGPPMSARPARISRRPARPRAPARAAPDRARPRVEGPAAAVGPHLPPDVLLPRQLPGRADPRLHRPLFATRRRGPGPLLRPRHDATPGLRRGQGRCRQRPQPVRPPADRGQGRAGDARAGGDPAGPLRLAWNAESAAGWPSASA